MKNQGTEREEDGSIMSIDRISQLPQHILHHILSFLSQNDAVRTCALSKSWRYLGSTRPNLEFFESSFNGNKETFMSVLDKTLQRYHDQKLSTQEFLLQMSLVVDSKSVSLLEKWIPIVILNMGVKVFYLSILSKTSEYFDFPSVVFKAESLEGFYLEGCKLNQISNSVVDKVLCKHLQTLSLTRVYIADETFEKIMSSCPSIEYVSLRDCEGLKTIKVMDKHRNHNLKIFDFIHENEEVMYGRDDYYCSIEIDVPTIETIRIEGCSNWFHHRNYLFPHLKSLCLNMVRLSTKSFDSFSFNFPCLEDLTLHSCYGFEEFQLLSRSVKHLTINMGFNKLIKATIDAPNILYFKYSGDFLPSISFTTTSSHEWKSDICLHFDDIDASSWFLKLNEVLKALSQSQISLDLSYQDQRIKDTYGGSYEHVAVEHLGLWGQYSCSSFSAFINLLFRICRPRYISAQAQWGSTEVEKLTKFLCKVLLQKRKRRDYYFWQRDLEEVRMEASDDYGEKWSHVQGTSLPKCALPNKQEIRFRLRWRD